MRPPASTPVFPKSLEQTFQLCGCCRNL
ncbi:protein of unknown function (plasmid) [Cupriavidus taiwanensis]|nr:protein of unknown function [Cupriavidus taiwanensis]SPD54315.1 protein of unknown function [Cupriavidus taiwanensis]